MLDMNALSKNVNNNLNFYDHINKNYLLTLELSFIGTTILKTIMILWYLTYSFLDLVVQ